MPTITAYGPGVMHVGTTSGTSSVSFRYDSMWVNWNLQYTTNATGSTVMPQWITWNTGYEETAEQAAGRERQHAESARLAAQANQRYRQAQERAEELLGWLLSDEQAASRREHGFFTVRGSRSGAVYRIHDTGISGNVDRLDASGHRDMVYCAHPPGVPAADVHLAQMLLLATDEDEFLRVANARAASRPALRLVENAPEAAAPAQRLMAAA